MYNASTTESYIITKLYDLLIYMIFVRFQSKH